MTEALKWVGKREHRFLVRGREPYLSAAVTLLAETGCVVRKWRTSTSGVADIRSADWLIEVPEPRGPVSYATLAHEVAHQVLHRSGSRPRWVEELEAWEWALATFARFDLHGLDKARADAAKALGGTAQKALGRSRAPLRRRELAREIVVRYPEWVLDRIAPLDPDDPRGYQRRRIELAEKRIAAAGYELRYVEYCEDADTPGLLGMYAGVTDHARRSVKVARRDEIGLDRLADTLEHEACHTEDPAWDCGNRDVFGGGHNEGRTL